MDETVEQRSGPALGAEGLGPFVEGEVMSVVPHSERLLRKGARSTWDGAIEGRSKSPGRTRKRHLIGSALDTVTRVATSMSGSCPALRSRHPNQWRSHYVLERRGRDEELKNDPGVTHTPPVM